MCALVTGVQTCALPIFQQPEAQARPGRKPYLMLGHSYYIDVNSVGTRFLLGKPTWAKFEDQRPFLASAWVAATHLFTIESIAGREMWARDLLVELHRFAVANILGRGAVGGQGAGNTIWDTEKRRV